MFDSAGIGLAGALAAGLLTLLSPCSVMLLPAFFSYAFSRPAQMLSRTAVFYLGLLITLVPLGVLAASVGAWISVNRQTLVTVGALVVLVLGVAQILALDRRVRTNTALGDTSAVSVFVLGTVYGLAGFCAGPLLGSVMTLAALGESRVYGGLVLAVFALGMVVPLVILALLWDKVPGVRRLVRPRRLQLGPVTTTWTNVIGGSLAIGVAVLLLLTQGTASLTGVFGVDEQAEMEQWALGLSSGLSDLAVLALLITVVVLAFVVRLLTKPLKSGSRR